MFDPNGYNWNNVPNPNPWYSTGTSGASMPQSMNTNVLKVTSLDEAIMKTNTRNSEMVYFNQSKDEFYCVRVDMNGNKTWQVFAYSTPSVNANIPVMRADYDALVARLDNLEVKLKEVCANEPDGQKPVQ
jgi:hypothetical protein